jgi:hypothetical protein
VTDQLGTQVRADDVVGQVQRRGLLAWQSQGQKAAVRVEVLELRVDERHDLRKERVDTHERRQRSAKRLASIVVR